MIGILKDDFGWQQIFEQEGIIYNILSNIPDEILGPIIVNRNLSELEASKIRNLLNKGLCILTDFPTLEKIITDFTYKPVKIPYILSDGSDIFNNITAIDLELNGHKTTPVIYQSNFGKGYIIALPFDVNQAICDTRNERKPFYYPSRKYPNEITSVVSKGEVRKLVVNCIRKLYEKMNLPYVHLWYFPKDYRSAFAFRVDTDFGPENSLQATFDLEEKTGVKLTYFVNTKVHPAPLYIEAEKETKEKSFHKQTLEHRCGASIQLANNQRDFQIHCYIHKVFKDYQRNYDNIKKAQEILENSGVKPIGFVSPFGFWNENLQKAMEDCKIQYSSEFSLAYDDLPFFPIIENRKSNVLQLPVHPICIGRLVHAGLTLEKCIDYYKRYFEKQLQANEPLLIYDHPHRIAQFPQVFYEILMLGKKLPLVWVTNMTEFYHWWKERLLALTNTQWQVESNKINIKSSKQNDKISLHITTPDQQETFLPLAQGIYNLKDLSYKSILMTKRDDITNYPKLKTHRTKLQIKFYRNIDKILELFETTKE